MAKAAWLELDCVAWGAVFFFCRADRRVKCSTSFRWVRGVEGGKQGDLKEEARDPQARGGGGDGGGKGRKASDFTTTIWHLSNNHAIRTCERSLKRTWHFFDKTSTIYICSDKVLPRIIDASLSATTLSDATYCRRDVTGATRATKRNVQQAHGYKVYQHNKIEHTAMLFSSEPVDGQGALSSQVTETQLFQGLGVDITYNSSPGPLTSITNLPFVSSPALATVEEEIDELDYDSDCQSGTNSWALVPKEEEQEDLSLADTWSEMSQRLDAGSVSSLAKAPDVTVKLEDSSLKQNEHETKVFHLTPFEQWIIKHVREAEEGGDSVTDGFHRLRNRN
ncbi:hypothetical protein C8R46DRAFT_1201614 [Mycena filopes]|nr:hypothetical protein C8R46DRAFT_1201614 [Mycena filopes]